MKQIVWVKIGNNWEENGDGPVTQKQGERIAREIMRECGNFTKVLPLNIPCMGRNGERKFSEFA